MGSEAVPLGAACTWRGLPDEEAWLACQKELAISTAQDSRDPFQQPELEAMAASYPSSSTAGVWPAVAASCVGSNSLLWSVRSVGLLWEDLCHWRLGLSGRCFNKELK